MITWCVVDTESVEVVNLYVDYVEPEDECIGCLDNLGFRHSTFKGENEVARVVIFCKTIPLSDRIEDGVNCEAKT